ncbi:hypothetical protein, partial [Vibrio anguillarum]|uniref:hypothetical protein n=1 Tax=Vibrio anguillarum TaxID=55601 RepID=UPI0019F1C870
LPQIERKIQPIEQVLITPLAHNLFFPWENDSNQQTYPKFLALSRFNQTAKQPQWCLEKALRVAAYERCRATSITLAKALLSQSLARSPRSRRTIQ